MSAGFDGYYDDPVGGGYKQNEKTCLNKNAKDNYNLTTETKTPKFHV